MDYIGFDQNAVKFLKNIAKNNNKEYFEAHRDEFERYIKNPSIEYVNEMGEHLMALAPSRLNAIPKVNGSLFRFFRDTRFSKNKTPLKEEVGLVIWQGDNKRLKSSSFYIQFNAYELFIAVGIRWFDKETLRAYREYIKDEKNASSLDQIYIELKKKGFEIAPASYKRYPKGFNKQSVYGHLALKDAAFAIKSYPIEKLYGSEFINLAFDEFEKMLPLQQWVYEMSKGVMYDK